MDYLPYGVHWTRDAGHNWKHYQDVRRGRDEAYYDQFWEEDEDGIGVLKRDEHGHRLCPKHWYNRKRFRQYRVRHSRLVPSRPGWLGVRAWCCGRFFEFENKG